MNYTITEEECNAIDAARGQLNLVADLLAVKGSESAPCNASDLCSFLSAQTDALKVIVNAVEGRHEASGDENNVMSCFDWMTIVQVVSGRRLLTSAALKGMGRKLQNCVKVNPDMAYVLTAWTDVMTDGGSLPFNLEPSSTDGFLIRFEERVPVVVTPSPAATVKKLRNKDGFCQEGANVIGKDYGGVADTTATAKKPTLRKRDKLAATAAAC